MKASRYRLLRVVPLVIALAVLTGCTRHKKGAEAFKHYFAVSPPGGVTLIQAHWAGFYIATGLDAEQIELEFVAPETVMSDLFSPKPEDEKSTALPRELERIFGWKIEPSEAVKRKLQSAPKWFVPAEAAVPKIVYVGGESAFIEFPEAKPRYQLIIYDSGQGGIYLDRLAGRAYISQENGKLF